MCRIRVEAPAGLHPLDIAQAVVGADWLLKAEDQPKGADRTWQDYKAMHTLAKRFEAAYKQQLDKIIRQIRKYVETRIVHGPLGKAGPKKPLVTPGQIHELRQIVEDYHQAFIAGTIGPDALKPAEVQRLIDAGVLPTDIGYTFQPGAKELPPEALNAIEHAYRYGHVLASARNLTEKRARHGITYEQFVQDWAPRQQLSEDERHSIEWLKQSAATEVRGLGNRVADDMATMAIEADADLRRRYVGLIRDSMDENVRRRETWRKLASDLGHRTGDWSRDMHRIAATEKQKAMQEGVTAGLVKRHGDPEDIRVAKQPNPDACPDCIRLHLTAGIGSPPRIFKLSDLISNGTNVGKKRQAWQATVGPVHPWCGCELIHVPDGMGFNEDGDLVPTKLTRSDWLAHDLRKAIKDPPRTKQLTYAAVVPDKGISVRVADPRVRAEIDKVIAKTPPEIFDKNVGVTLITTDIPRVQNPFDDNDYAYWTGNEIRLAQTLPAERIDRVLTHEISHSLNVYLMRKWGTVQTVRNWHDKLWKISKREGWVSDYAKKLPIENAAEVTRQYLYHRRRMMLRWPKQFAECHRVYRDLWTELEAA